MARTINQPTVAPTRKLGAATIAAVIVSGTALVVRNVWPDWYDDALWHAMTPVVAFIVGYVVRDEPNTVHDFNGEL